MRAVPFFYYFLTFISFQVLEGLSHTIGRGGANFSPRYPIFWAENLNYPAAATTVVVVFLLTALLGAFFFKKRLARVLAFLGVFQYHAFLNSFGGLNHQYDLLLWVSFLLILLPEKDDSKKSLLVIRGIQGFILLTYSMSGLGKLYGGLKQFIAGVPSIFHVDAAALHASSLLNRMHEVTPLANFVINYPVLSWLLLLGAIYLEIFSLAIVFRPSLHRIWALGLILFHLGTYLAMRAIFVQPVALLLLFFFASPFQTKKPLRETLGDLPLFGLFFKRL